MQSVHHSPRRIAGLVATVALAGLLVGFGAMPVSATDEAQPGSPTSAAVPVADEPVVPDVPDAALGDAVDTVPRVTVQMAVTVEFTGDYYGAVRMGLYPLCYMSGALIPDSTIATSVLLPKFEGHDGTYPLQFDLTLPLGAACDRVGWRTYIDMNPYPLCWRAIPYIRLDDIYTVTDDHPVWQADLQVSIIRQSCPIATEPATDPETAAGSFETDQPRVATATEPDAAQLAATGAPLLPAGLGALLLLGAGAVVLALRRRSSGGQA